MAQGLQLVSHCLCRTWAGPHHCPCTCHCGLGEVGGWVVEARCGRPSLSRQARGPRRDQGMSAEEGEWVLNTANTKQLVSGCPHPQQCGDPGLGLPDWRKPPWVQTCPADLSLLSGDKYHQGRSSLRPPFTPVPRPSILSACPLSAGIGHPVSLGAPAADDHGQMIPSIALLLFHGH